MSESQLPDSPAERWYRLASEDLAAADVMLASEGAGPPRVACFLAQQAAEKALKAGLIRVDVDFPKVHGLGALLRLYPSDAQPHVDEDDLDQLDPWIVDGRYAADLPPVDVRTAQLLVEASRRVVLAVRHVLDGS